MREFNADLHLHGPRSIGVSKAMDVPSIVAGARQKGLSIVGTGDCFQPDWRSHLGSVLERQGDVYTCKDVSFIMQTEVEDAASVHHVILFPDFDAIDAVKHSFHVHSSNIDHPWGGRPRVNLSPAEIVETCTVHGALAGPAHAFTPFKSVFRQGKYDRLSDAYGAQTKNVVFLELGLSANTDHADRIGDLHGITFLSNSDAHAPGPQSLGREFNTVDLDSPSFAELELALRRKSGRRVVRNVGFDPRLGKYHVLFCKTCRRRVLVVPGRDHDRVSWDDQIISYPANLAGERHAFLQAINAGHVSCPACMNTGKKASIKLGVSERVELLADLPPGHHPSHRPPYVNVVPLTEIIRVASGVGSATSKRVNRLYDGLIEHKGPEIVILFDVDLDGIDLAACTSNPRDRAIMVVIKDIIASFRNGTIDFKPGGGGTFGQLLFEA